MDPAAVAAWPAVCRAHEGVTTWMYLDTKGLVTCGVGFLIDTPEAAAALPWLTKVGEPATPRQVELERRAVKLLQDWRQWNGLNKRWRDRAQLHLTDAAVDARLAEETPRYWRGVVRSAPNVDQAPPSVQLALIDLAWQNGPAFLDGWPDTRAAVRSGDWNRVADVLAKFLPAKAARTAWRLAQFRAAALTPTPIPPEDPAVPAVKWSKSSRWAGKQYRWWRNGNMTPTGIAVCEAVPSPVWLSQGGLSTSVSASANTHAGLGGYDISVKGWNRKKVDQLCAELIRSGECAFPRGGLWGTGFFVQHIHVASNNDYGSLHPEAQAQVRGFKANPRRNGLSGRSAGRYVGPSTPLGSWSSSPYNRKNIKDPAAAQYVVTSGTLQGLDVDRKPRARKLRKKGFVIDAHKLVRRWCRWNVLTTAGTYYAVSDSRQTYRKPVVPKPVPAPAAPQEKTS